MSNLSDNLSELLAPLQALQHLIEKFDGRGIFIGGIAANLLGTPRLTTDLDAVFLLSVTEIGLLLEAAEAEGIVPRIENIEAFARKNRVLLLRHRDSDINIDISLGILPFEEEMVARSQIVEFGTLAIRIPTPEDLIILKAVAHRPKDLFDIQAIVQNHHHLDARRIESWVRQFAQALELPELWDDIAGWLL